MTQGPTIDDRMEEDAINGVQRMTVDGMSVDAMSVDDRIKAANHLAKKQAVKRNHLGMTMVKLVPPGGGL